MQRYRELKDFEPSVNTSCVVVNTGAHVNNMVDTVGLTYRTPEYIRLYKRFLDDAPDNYRLVKDRWRPCQSYESRVVDDTPFNSAGKIPWVTWSSNLLRRFQVSGPGPDRMIVAGYRNFRDAYGEFGLHSAGLPSMTETVINSLSFVPKPTGLSTLVTQSLRAMLPHVKAELSLVNSVIELKDFKTLLPTLTRLKDTSLKVASLAKSLASSKGPAKVAKFKSGSFFDLVRRSFNPDQGLTLRELLHSTADGYLQAEFNILPFIRDVRDVFKACHDLSKTMNSLVGNQGRPRRKHYTFKWVPAQFTGADKSVIFNLNLDQFAGTENGGGTLTGVYRYYSLPLRATRQVVVDQPAIFHAEIEYQYWFSQYQNEHARVLTLLDKLGVNLSPQIIWNAIPWSFVIDWVIGVGRYLGSRKVINMEPDVCIRRYLWSWETSRKIKTYYEGSQKDAYGSPLCPRTYLPDIYETIYRRDVDMPAHSNPLYADGLSGTELSLGAALTITQAWHPTRGRR